MKKRVYPFIFIAVSLLALGGCKIVPQPSAATGTKESIDCPPSGSQTGGNAFSPIGDTGESTKQGALFQDPGFGSSVRLALSIPGNASDQEMLDIMEQAEYLGLHATSVSISSLEDLDYFPNLRELLIDQSIGEIADLSPIGRAQNLESVTIRNLNLKGLDLSFAGRLPKLKKLTLTECGITDISSLERADGLEHLSLYGNEVMDASPLSRLTRLRELSLNENASELEHYESLQSLSLMEDLGLSGCGLEDIEFVRKMPNLKAVNVNNNKIQDLSPLAQCRSLERLGARGNHIEDIRPLKDLTKLFDLALDDNRIADITVLGKLTELNQLGISANQIKDISCLKKLDKLFLCNFGRNPAKDITPLFHIPYVTFYADGGNTPDSKDLLDIQSAQDGINVRENMGQWAQKAQEWLGQNCADMHYYALEDISIGDMDKDGITDMAVVFSCMHEDKGGRGNAMVMDVNFTGTNNRPVGLSQEQIWDNSYRYGSRNLILLLGNRDGSFHRAGDEPCLSSYGEGGMRGDPFRGILMGDGFLMTQESWGSRSGYTETNCYRYVNGRLKLVRSNVVGDDNYAGGYDVSMITYPENQTESFIYAQKDNYNYVRIPKSFLKAPEGAPRIGLYFDYGSGYYYYENKQPANLSAEYALNRAACEMNLLFAALNWDMGEDFFLEKKEISYAGDTREYYEKLRGISLPGFYYKGQGTLAGETDTGKTEIILKYNRYEWKSGKARHCCLVQYRKPGKEWVDWREMYVNDTDGRVYLD